jgi:ATP-dependent Lon protease
MYWRGEMQFIVAAGPGAAMRDRFQHPALQILMFGRWDNAFAWLHSATEEYIGAERAQDLLDTLHDIAATQSKIADIIEYLYSVGTPRAGARALAWEMLTADPRKPHSFSFLPQLQFAIDNADLEAEDDADVRERIRIWWRAAEGEWTDSKFSVFRIAAIETAPGDDLPDPVEPFTTLTSDELTEALGLPVGPTLVVMPKSKASKLNNFHAQYKDLVDAALPVVIARDVSRIRAALHAEFPHAVTGVDLLLRDLREAKPTRLAPICLVGSPGCGKSRLVRRLADFLRVYVYRYDAASSADSQFGGTGKAWSNTEPSVPARAVAQSKTANPTVLIDEIDKAAARNWNGRLWDALLPFLDRETAGRYRDQSLDCELNLSMVSYVATANDATKLPSPLRDRFRIIKIPAPTLQHLPALAAQVMRDLAIEDESRQADAPLAGDELAVIAKAWSRAGFSMRALQKIVGVTLEARDSHAMRH